LTMQPQDLKNATWDGRYSFTINSFHSLPFSCQTADLIKPFSPI
jgi:hypothetical protein